MTFVMTAGRFSGRTFETPGLDLRALREAAGISMREMARRCGYSVPASINQVEKGRQAVPEKVLAIYLALREVKP